MLLKGVLKYRYVFCMVLICTKCTKIVLSLLNFTQFY